MTDLVGKRLGEFEVVRELGRGGMGVVYEAMQTSLHRRVALKVIGPGLGLTPRAVVRFRREAESAAKLHHTNIVPVYATGEADGFHFYAMELIEGPSLDRVIAELREARLGTKTPTLAPELTATGPYLDATTPSGSGVSSGLSSRSGYFDTVAKMTADVADALHHAHASNVIHRDVKPGNLLLGADGRLSVNDFGLARALEEPGMTSTGEFVGTPAYMAPEQIAGGRVPVDHRCDVYSLGATLYHLLTLRPPFVAEGRDRLLGMVIQKDPVPPRALNPQVPRDLETICLKCLEKDPDRRYQTAQALADDLRRYVNRFTVLAKRAGPFTKLKKWVKRNPALAAAGVAASLGLGAAGAFAWRAHEAESQRASDRQRHEDALRAERWLAVLERVHLATMTGDTQVAETGLRDAEELDVSPGQVAMLRGLVAYHQGRIEESTGHLVRSVELMPASVAAWSLLAMTHAVASQWDRYHECLAQANRLEPVSAEDLLFKGYAQSPLDPWEGVRTFDQALRLRPASLIGRLLRAEARTYLVIESADPDQAAVAQEDAAMVVDLLAGNPITHRISLEANLAAANAYRHHGLTDRADAALETVRRDERVLRTRSSPENALARWEYFRNQGKERVLLAEMERIYADTKSMRLAMLIGSIHCRAGEIDRATEAIGPHAGEPLADLVRALLLAEQAGGRDRALALIRDLIRKDVAGWDMFNALTLLRLLGEPDEATEKARQFCKRPDRFVPIQVKHFRDALGHAAGELSDDAFLRATEGSRGDRCNAQFCIAVARLAAGDRSAAKKCFRAAIDTHAWIRFPYELSHIFLVRIDADPNWPLWIPHVAPPPRPKP